MEQPREMTPTNRDKLKEMVPERVVRQESSEGQHGDQLLVCIRRSPPRHSLQPCGLQYDLQRVSRLVETYCGCRKLLGSNVEMAHANYHKFVSVNINPLLIACVLSFSVVSAPETIALLSQQWEELRQQMHYDSPDYNIARFMVQYAFAWALQSQDLEKAYTKVKACYNDMKKLNPENFFLAPFYTVTISRWMFKINERRHTLSEDVLREVVAYADETLRLIDTLEDDWARIDTFGVKLSALNLLMLVESHCKDTVRLTAFCENLRPRIDHLYEESSRDLLQNRSKISLYEAAWFHSVSATYYQNANTAATTQEEKDKLYTFEQCSLAQSAGLYHKNGRLWRASEEAKRSDDPAIKRKYGNPVPNGPSVDAISIEWVHGRGELHAEAQRSAE